MQPNHVEKKRVAASPAELKEVLAFLLLELAGPPADSDESVPITRWQSSQEVRCEQRALAGRFIEELDRRGIVLRAADSRRVAAQLLHMRTIPQRVAYHEDELR